MESLIPLLIVGAIILFLKHIKKFGSGLGQISRGSRSTGPPGNSKTDHGSFVQYQTSVKADTDIYLYLSVDIQKNEADYVVDIKSKITDSDGTDYGYDEDRYNYNVKSRKWIEGAHPFNERTPSSFVTFMVNAWQEVNGPLPERTKRVAPTKVNISEELIELPQYKEEDLNKLPDRIEVDGTEGETYLVNLALLECTCHDFKKRRIGYQKTDIRRACKHIAKQIVKKQQNTKLSKNSMVQAFVRHASSKYKGVPPFDKMILVHCKI